MSLSPSRQAAIYAYRNLLKTQKSVFSGDIKAIQAAKKETHSRFMQYKDESNVDILDEKLKLAEQVCNLLKQNEVKAVANENTMKLHVKGREGDVKFGDVGKSK